MRISEAIARMDPVNGGVYPDEALLQWLSECEGELNSTAFTGMELPDEELIYDLQRDLERELRVKAPYDGLYLDYLTAQVHYHNGDIARYNNAVTRYNQRLQAYGDMVHRRKLQKDTMHIKGVGE